jgi:hypothetical protein
VCGGVIVVASQCSCIIMLCPCCMVGVVSSSSCCGCVTESSPHCVVASLWHCCCSYGGAAVIMLSLVFKGPVHRTEKKTEQDRLGPDQWSIYGPVFCSPVAGLSFCLIL